MKRKMTRLKSAILSVALISVIGASVPSSIYAYNNYQYKKYIELGDKALNDGNLENSLNYYNQALSFNEKRKLDIDSKVKLVEIIKESDLKYDEGMQLFSNRKYLEAIEAFSKVSDKDVKNYNQAKEKADTSKLEYISINIDTAKASAKNKDYANALTFLDDVLKIDSGNDEAKKLKADYEVGIKIMEESEAKKLQDEQKSKQETPVTVQTTSKSVQATNNNTTTSKTPEAKYTIKALNGMFAEIDSKGNFGRSVGLRLLKFAIQPVGIYYTLSGENVDYTITIYAPSRTIVESGKASSNIKIIPVRLGEIPEDQEIKVNVTITWDGKKYSSTFNRIINGR